MYARQTHRADNATVQVTSLQHLQAYAEYPIWSQVDSSGRANWRARRGAIVDGQITRQVHRAEGRSTARSKPASEEGDPVVLGHE